MRLDLDAIEYRTREELRMTNRPDEVRLINERLALITKLRAARKLLEHFACRGNCNGCPGAPAMSSVESCTARKLCEGVSDAALFERTGI